MKKRNKGSGGASWMDTYGDMVTLLLCFFVLLYSMSSIDQQKWVQLVQSFNPDAVTDSTQSGGYQGQLADPAGGTGYAEEAAQDQQTIDTTMEQLYIDLKNYVAQQGRESAISVTKGNGYVFISFNETVFFDGDSYAIRQDGKVVLDDTAAILQRASGAIDELRILGHTAQASANQTNNVTDDRFLASNRATEVLVYLQLKNILDPARMVSMGYGQWRPVSDNDNDANRSKNRRVEMIVTGKYLSSVLGDQIEQYYTERGGDAAITATGE